MTSAFSSSWGMIGEIGGEIGDGGFWSKLRRVECRITFTRGDARSSLSSLLNQEKISGLMSAPRLS
jgi:hypothetical protein